MMEAYVWEHVKALLSDPVVLRMPYAQGHGDPAVDVRAEQERVRLERKLASLDREVTRLIDAYQAEVIDLPELAERRRRIEDQGRMLRERVREIAQQRTERSTELRLLEGVDAFCTSVRGAMEGPFVYHTAESATVSRRPDGGGGQSGDHRARHTDRACSIANGTSCGR
jgi:site-specific DNA recombinase